MKLLLLGADGQLGRAIQAVLSTEYLVEVVPLSHQQLDITDTIKLKQTLAVTAPDIVVNCAAYTRVAMVVSDAGRCVQLNQQAVAALAVLCQQYGIALVHFSTDYVFDGLTDRPYTELDNPAPLNLYGASKLAAEQLIQRYCQRYLILRTSWLFSNQGENFYRNILNQTSSGKAIRVVDDQYGCPTSAVDLAYAIRAVVLQYQQQGNLRWGLYHYAGWPVVSWYQFAEAILQQQVPQALTVLQKAKSTDFASLVRRPSYSALDSRLFRQTFGVEEANWQQALSLLAVSS